MKRNPTNAPKVHQASSAHPTGCWVSSHATQPAKVFRKQHRGVIAIEVAILTPLVLLFFMLAVELGFFFSFGYQLQQASYRSARYAAQHWDGGATVKENTKQVAVYGVPYGVANNSLSPLLPGLNTNDVTFPDTPDGYITVLIQYDYQPIFPLAELPGLNLGKTLQAQSVMRVL